jgi:hypothetical protein
MIPPLIRPGFTLHRLDRHSTPWILAAEHRCWADRRDRVRGFPMLWPGRTCQGPDKTAGVVLGVGEMDRYAERLDSAADQADKAKQGQMTTRTGRTTND